MTITEITVRASRSQRHAIHGYFSSSVSLNATLGEHEDSKTAAIRLQDIADDLVKDECELRIYRVELDAQAEAESGS